MKLAIVGGRTFSDQKLFEESILAKFTVEEIDLIVSGGASGADHLAEVFAKKHGISTQIFKPDWNLYGKRAAYVRNKLIVENSDQVIAFWDGESPGTKMTIGIAKEMNKECVIVKIPKLPIVRVPQEVPREVQDSSKFSFLCSE